MYAYISGHSLYTTLSLITLICSETKSNHFCTKLHNEDQSQEWASRLLTDAFSAGLQNNRSSSVH